MVTYDFIVVGGGSAGSHVPADNDNATRRVSRGTAAKIALTRTGGISRGKAPLPTSTPIDRPRAGRAALAAA